ncbi:hypothetical protein LTR17_013102 [Elasticomyces elasticus]|nr:hypothetical protein LTR17_013102 [Elasticomyces elasticus]
MLAEYGKQYVDNKSTRVSAASPPAVGISGDALPSLPVELVEHLATFLASWDLLAIRATCRELAAKIQRPYSKAHFTANKSFLLPDEWSMQALIGISSHPVFSKTITSVSLLPLMLMDTTEDEFYARGEWFGLPYGAEHATAEERIAMRQVDWTAYQHTRARQEQYWASQSWHKPLSGALKNFAANGASIELHFRRDHDRRKSNRNGPLACGELRLGY